MTTEQERNEWRDEAASARFDMHSITVPAEFLESLIHDADERDRYRALLVEARRGYLKDGTIFAREVDAALEGKHD